MSDADADICGHVKNDGEKCTYSPKYDDGKCGHHTEHDTGAERREGRPSKLSYERQEKIATAIESGKSMNSAARMAGVDPTTVYNWLDRGESELKADKDNEYTEFYQRITHAKGHGEDFYFNLALELARENEDHRFIASLMKQRYPDSWAETETGVDADKTVINVPDSVAEKWERSAQID
jgi:transposase-like protein